MNKYQIIIGLIGILTIIFFGIGNKTSADKLTIFDDKNIGIQMKIPKYLKPFPPKEMSFSDCYDCMGLLYIKSELASEATIEEILEHNIYKHQTIIGETTIDGMRAIITTFTNTDGAGDQRFYYVIKDDVLYSITLRSQNLAYILQNIKLIGPGEVSK